MHTKSIALALALLGTGLTVHVSRSASQDFDIKGVWAAGTNCSDAELFVEFDGRDVLGGSRTSKARLASYSAAADSGRVTLDVRAATSDSADQVSFLIDDRNGMRLDSALVTVRTGGKTELMKLTRCGADI